jgi:hypothetical protein
MKFFPSDRGRTTGRSNPDQKEKGRALNLSVEGCSPLLVAPRAAGKNNQP